MILVSMLTLLAIAERAAAANERTRQVRCIRPADSVTGAPRQTTCGTRHRHDIRHARPRKAAARRVPARHAALTIRRRTPWTGKPAPGRSASLGAASALRCSRTDGPGSPGEPSPSDPIVKTARITTHSTLPGMACTPTNTTDTCDQSAAAEHSAHLRRSSPQPCACATRLRAHRPTPAPAASAAARRLPRQHKSAVGGPLSRRARCVSVPGAVCRLRCRRGAMQTHVLRCAIPFAFCAQSAAHRNRK